MVKRWYDLETGAAPAALSRRELLQKWLVPGDISRIARRLGLTIGHVSAVGTGKATGSRVMNALLDQAVLNKKNGISSTSRYEAMQLKMDFLNGRVPESALPKPQTQYLRP